MIPKLRPFYQIKLNFWEPVWPAGALAMTDVRGLAAAWDANPAVRESLRAKEALIKEVSEKNVDIKMASKHSALLAPILERMFGSAKKKVPSIEDLRAEVREVLTMNKHDPDATSIEKYAWHIRKNLGFVKLKCRRREVSTEPRHHMYIQCLVSFVCMFTYTVHCICMS